MHATANKEDLFNKSTDFLADAESDIKYPSVKAVADRLGVLLPAATAGSVLFSNGTTLTQDNNNLFWDNTNKRLGIGTKTPAYRVDINNGSTSGIIQRLTTTGNDGYITLTAGTRTVRFGADATIGPHFGSTVKGGFAFLDDFSTIPLRGLAVANGNNNFGSSSYRFSIFYGRQINVNGTGPNYFAGNVGVGTETPTSKLQVVGLPIYLTNALALAGGLTAGAFYHAGDGIVRVVY